jgi:hypothetical protein
MAERLVDVLNEQQTVLHTFRVETLESAPLEEKFQEKALSAAAHAQLVPTEELEMLSARMHVSRRGQLTPYGDSLDITTETKAGLEQIVRERAYLLWEQAGCPEDRQDEFWHLAHKQRLRERAYRLWEQEGRPEGQAERHWHWTRDFEDT